MTEQGKAPAAGPRGPVHVWAGAHPRETICGLPGEPGMVGTEHSLHLVTCKDCERALHPPPSDSKG